MDFCVQTLTEAGQAHLKLFLLKMKDFTPPLTPPQGGELEEKQRF
jgi:hypothetical protein